ncbi:anti-sigma factor family protein [Cohnella fermenti]|uniref:Anti-sigma-W factor RsiW n=1 Tax=Cohnella fermenti TaxID=2565925 RepID=A0A4S4BYW6_9BACL|nr:zf-HC2 domain-containing protein [Cohnella fermenti]THF78387.1 zf-HC2 domain-containing protein [Cohnella fermenti]
MRSDCDVQQRRFSDYWDDALSSHERIKFELHLSSCASCKEEYRFWEESAALIREIQLSDVPDVDSRTVEEINRNVMNRIYAEQNWFTPASRRLYAFSGRFRRRMGSLLGTMLTLFVVGLLYAVYAKLQRPEAPYTGVMEMASAAGAGDSAPGGMIVDVPVASLSDPIVLHVDPAIPEYWIAFALLGVLMSVLTMNWFARVRT